MSAEELFPTYIHRDEERQILGVADLVRNDRKSRAVLLYGPGGVGKTSLVRRLGPANAGDPGTAWVAPVDIDDSEYWLLSNLERHVASRLDPRNKYFERYLEYLFRLSEYTRPRIGYETVVSHLARIKSVFAECYKEFAEDTGKTIVIVLDAIEVIRGMYLLQTLTHWMKELPATMFILAGRPVPGTRHGTDPIREELEDPYKPMPVTVIELGEFSHQAALDYLSRSGIAAGLSDLEKEKEKLVYLTRGHPLWLAFTVDYLRTTGIPEEATEHELAAIEAEVPYRGDMTQAGQGLHEAFMRRLVAPYHETDFWHETLKRLAVVRESVSQPVWASLMADRPLPDGVSAIGATWDELLRIPWIRPRANRRYITLHDALAEELAQRIIPIHDQDEQWRRELWRRAEQIYADLSQQGDTELSGKLSRLYEELDAWSVALAGAGTRLSATEEAKLVTRAAELEAHRRELSQVKAVRLYYQMLCDFNGGCQSFLDLMEQAKEEHDILFQDLLAAEIQRFLPIGAYSHASGDTVGEVVDDFRQWLASDEGQESHLDIGLSLADYLIRTEKPRQAIELLESLPRADASPIQRVRLSNLEGNAAMRIPGQVRKAEKFFQRALTDAGELPPPHRLRLIAKAHKELGFYYRNTGLWTKADKAYAQARDAISQTLLTETSAQDREEMASIQSNWAYVKGLTGRYRDGTNLAQSAITVRRRLKNTQEEGISWSVLGEVHRYEGRFRKAWEAYAEAEHIFQQVRNWAWLGLVYQEQAICLYQSAAEGVDLVPDPQAEARRLITLGLDLCRDLAVRGYPSALNRAGRIYSENFDLGIRYLSDGIEESRRLSDGWFWLANLVEHAELCYQAWVHTGRSEYLVQISDREPELQHAIAEYAFPHLNGRWQLVQGHILVRRSLELRDETGLADALKYYQSGFPLIALEYVGPSGAGAVADEFRALGELMQDLSPQVRAEWQSALRRSWSSGQSGTTLLLAGLEELY